MELWFNTESSAEASLLAQELELTLRQRGVPANAIAFRPMSSENMDVGSVLSLSLEMIDKALGPISAVATVVGCLHQMISAHGRGVVVERDDVRTVIPPKVNRARIEAALAARPKPKPKRRAQG